MREILFRGKRLDNGEWVEGGYYHEDYTDFKYITFWNSYGLGFMDSCKVDPETVGQYTGLKDKNGRKIFEGDIVAIERGWGEKVRYEVKYDATICSFIGDCVNYIGFTTFEGDGELFDVIGNVHDNPELLEVEE